MLYSRKRLLSFLDEVARSKDVRFPYPDSEAALEKLEVEFRDTLSYIDALQPNSDPLTVQAACASALSALFLYVPLLGFIRRSTGVRNPFEAYGPLLRLAQTLLGNETKLVISSEWEHSPFTYQGVKGLEDFVFIGLPATESENPLLLPLAGHELGHHLWARHDVGGSLSSDIENKVRDELISRWSEYQTLYPGSQQAHLNDLIVKPTWEPAIWWTIRQAEVSFCDFVGAKLFASSYLHAFGYLLSPSSEEQRSMLYPNTRRRVEDLKTAAETYGFTCPDEFVGLFDDLSGPLHSEVQTKFLLELADTVSSSLVIDLIGRAGTIIDSVSIPSADDEEVRKIYERFKRNVVPSSGISSITPILNAAWRAFHDRELWKDRPEIQDKDATLRELVLKSIEILEIENRTG